MRSAGTSAMVLLRGLVQAAAESGVDRVHLLARIGVSEERLESDASVPTLVLAHAWQAAPELSGDPLFGLHASEHAAIGSYDLLDYIFLTSTTLGEACLALVRFHPVVSEIWRLELVVEGETARFQQWVPAEYVEPLRHAWDYFFAGALARIRRALPPASPREVHLMHAAPAGAEEYERVFGCPVQFSRPVSEFVFDAAYLEAPLASADPALHRIVRRHAEELLARVPADHDVLARARVLMTPELTLVQLAEQLGVGERTLQRKLAEHGITYKQLVQQAREEQAMRALEAGALSVQEVAYQLGFNSTAAFSRAFKRWRGITPSEWRARRPQSTN